TRAPYAVALSGVISSDMGYGDVFVAQYVVRLLPRYDHAALVRHAVERHQLPISRGVLCQNPTSRRSLRYPSSRRLRPSRFRPPRSWRSARSTRASLLRRSPKSFLIKFAGRSPCHLKARWTSGGL